MASKSKSKSIKDALDNLDNQVVGVVSEFVKRRRGQYEEAAARLHQSLKEDAARYAEMLADEKISKEDFEFLMKGRYSQMKIELLSEVAISKAKFDEIVGEVLKITIKVLLVVI